MKVSVLFASHLIALSTRFSQAKTGLKPAEVLSWTHENEYENDYTQDASCPHQHLVALLPLSNMLRDTLAGTPQPHAHYCVVMTQLHTLGECVCLPFVQGFARPGIESKIIDANTSHALATLGALAQAETVK